MQAIQPTKAKVKLFALVRDPQGKPKFDDINNIPGPIWGMLTDAEQREILTQRKTLKTSGA